MIDKATVARILNAADIVEVVSDYVHLQRRGSGYIGLCPFHNERTPSFSVSPQRGICKCFSCGKGGSPVNFIMEKEGINFHDALLVLARKYGIQVEERQLTDEERAEQSHRESLMLAGDWAQKHFQENLTDTEEGRNVGLQYFYGRGVTQAAIKEFRLGYAIDKPSEMYEAAMKAGIPEQTLLETGICGKSERDGRPYDRFRGRVIFPILSASGRPIAFGGRGIKGERAKYVNSPESQVYHKSDTLYGLFQAKNAIVREKKCFLVEGYMDVIGMWQSGMQNVVASSGTSLTQGQIALIHRFTENVTLIYDGDAAGIHASFRGIDMLLGNKMNLRVLLLPDGDDPDSFARKHTPEEFQEYVGEHEEDFIDFKTRILLDKPDQSPAERAQAVQNIVLSIASVPDLVQRQLYIRQTAARLGVREDAVAMEVQRAREGVVDNLRRQRQQEHLKAEESRPKAPSSVGAPDISNAKSFDTLVQPQKTLCEYLIKYGMYYIGSFTDENGQDVPITVAEYIHNELDADSMQFTVPAYARLMERILHMLPFYNDACNDFLIEQQQAIEQKRVEWQEQMAGEALPFETIQAKEKEFEARMQEELTQTLGDFACNYISSQLVSDPDDELRNLVTDVIVPRYELSKYHARVGAVTDDRTRLDELLPRAISEWKFLLLQQREKALMDEVSSANDYDTLMRIMPQLRQIKEMLTQLSSVIGDRIVINKV